MGAAPKLKDPEPEVPLFDFSKPVRMRWWRLPAGTFVGSGTTDISSVAVLPIPTRINDGYDISGLVEVIEMYPGGQVVAHIRCGVTDKSPGTLKQLVFVGGQGAPLARPGQE